MRSAEGAQIILLPERDNLAEVTETVADVVTPNPLTTLFRATRRGVCKILGVGCPGDEETEGAPPGDNPGIGESIGQFFGDVVSPTSDQLKGILLTAGIAAAGVAVAIYFVRRG